MEEKCFQRIFILQSSQRYLCRLGSHDSSIFNCHFRLPESAVEKETFLAKILIVNKIIKNGEKNIFLL